MSDSELSASTALLCNDNTERNMTIYFGSSTDDELIAELKERGYFCIKAPEAHAAHALAKKELDRLVQENFGRVPRDAWADVVLNLRDSTDDQPLTA